MPRIRDRWKRTTRSAGFFIYRSLPKFRIAVLYALPHCDDSMLALEKSLRETSIRKTVILVSSSIRPRPQDLGPRTLVLEKNSIRGVLHFLVAKYVFFTHYMHRFPPKVVSVNVWHGMPVKRVGWMEEGGNIPPVATYTLATSPLWADIMQQSMRPAVGTLVTGLPRNDRLLFGGGRVPERFGYPAGTREKLILWLPTFRATRDEGTGNPHYVHALGMDLSSFNKLDGLLRSHQALLVVKPHPFVGRTDLPESTNLKAITDEWLHEQGLTLYQFLGEFDALITDVSSVYVDFLILDRPIVHHFPDIREYGLSRGFSVSPIEDYLAGPLTRDSDELLEAIAAILNNEDTHVGQRRRVRALFHTHLDASASARVLEQLGL